MSADAASLSIDEARLRLDRTLTDPPIFERPDRWTFTKAWQRAQTESIVVGSTRDPARYRVLLGDGSPHEVLFTIYGGELRTECDCGAFRHHYDGAWCPHVAALWWRWAVKQLLVVVDVDTNQSHVSPPPWLRVGNPARRLPERDDARADGGAQR